MRRKKSTVILIWVLIAIGFVVGMKIKTSKDDSGLKIVKWNNLYEGKNIHFYYGSSDKNISNSLKENYQLEKVVGEEKDDFAKMIKLLKWTNEKLNYKDDVEPLSGENGAIDILEKIEKDKKKKYYSDTEYTTIFNESCIALGITSRIGELVTANDTKIKEKESFKVCEIWSVKYKKWMMVDPANGCYLAHKGLPMSVTEIIEKGIDNLTAVGIENSDKYKKNMKKYFYSYIVPIDNSIYGIKNSNSYIGYISKDIEAKIPIKISMKHPVIFTNSNYLFGLSPNNKYVEKKEDKIPTLIFSKKKSKENLKIDNKANKKEIQFWGGVFKDSVMVENYYISINNEPFREVNNYFEFSIKDGMNTVKLSADGKNMVREVVFELKEK